MFNFGWHKHCSRRIEHKGMNMINTSDSKNNEAVTEIIVVPVVISNLVLLL